MSDTRPPGRGLESLRKEAKRWLAALRAGDPDARARLERATPEAPAHPTLRDVQHALAREHGRPGWTALRDAVAAREVASSGSATTQARYEAMAEALLDAYRTGTPEAMEQLYRFTWHRRTWSAMRRYVQLDLGKRPAAEGGDVEITLDDARWLVAVEHGFAGWEELRRFAATTPEAARLTAKPVRVVEGERGGDHRTVAATRDWDEIVRALAEHPTAQLFAEGQMTDEVLARVARLEGLEALSLAGSWRVSDEGVRHLARAAALTRLDLSGTGITDAALDVLRDLPRLERLSLAGTAISDAGAARLAHCPQLEQVDLGGTRTGDGALRALAGKARLRELHTGRLVSDRGIALLHEIPRFATWHGGELRLAMFEHDAPTRLTLRGTFGDAGLAALRGLDGLCALNLDDASLAITAGAMPHVASLPRLGVLAVDAKDDWMPHIAAMPRLRALVAQDTTAGDDGFVALGRSPSIEYLWGRRCHNLRRRGFVALAEMPALRGLSVSCLNVDDAGIAALPGFPALRELMPMDVPDAGYRHIGRCERLESLVLMYCRDTTDAATERITGLRDLSYYFNSYTTITDRTPEILSGMDSLERITFDACHELTDGGVARLARLPRLRELRVAGRRITPAVSGAFPARVRVHVGG